MRSIKHMKQCLREILISRFTRHNEYIAEMNDYLSTVFQYSFDAWFTLKISWRLLAIFLYLYQVPWSWHSLICQCLYLMSGNLATTAVLLASLASLDAYQRIQSISLSSVETIICTLCTMRIYHKLHYYILCKRNGQIYAKSFI